MSDDAELLSRYAADHSEAAITELIQRHVDLVYSAAVRLVSGDAHRAQDVTQQVFAALARQASRLAKHPALVGWLYSTTRRMALHANRSDQRRAAREQEAHAMNELLRETAPEADWDQLRPVLEDAMHDLAERDRLAVLLRYFQDKPLKDVGAVLGLNENAARMRVDRALAKLHSYLARRGVTSTSAALAMALASHSVTAAPPGLISVVSSAAVNSLATGTSLTILNLMTYSKLKIGFAFGLATALVVGVAILVNTATSKSAPPASSSAGFEIIPGVSVGPVKLGMARPEVERVLGKAGTNDLYPALGMLMTYDASSSPQRVAQIVVLDSENEMLPGMMDFKSFAGATKEGIRIGSAGTDIVKAYSEPESSDLLAASWEGLNYVALGMSVSLQDGRTRLIRIAKPSDPSLMSGRNTKREVNPSPAVATSSFQIVPGSGVGPIRFGMSVAEVERILGKPVQVLGDSIHQYYQDGLVIIYSRAEPRRVQTIDVIGAGKSGTNTIAASGLVYFDFAGATKEGIRIGSTRDDLIKAFGAPRVAPGEEPDSPQAELSFPALRLTARLERGTVTRLGLSAASPRR